MPTAQLFLQMLNNADLPGYPVTRDEAGAVICRLGEVTQSVTRFESLIRGPRSLVFWHKKGLLKKLNEKFQNETEQGLRHVIYPFPINADIANNRFARVNNRHYFIKIKINPEATVAEVRDWLLSAGYTIEFIVKQGVVIDENMTMNSLAEQQHQLQREQMENSIAARTRQEQLDNMGAEFEEPEVAPKISELKDYIKNLPDSEMQKIFEGFDKKVKNINDKRAAGNSEECIFTREEIILESGDKNEYIMILTCDDKNGANPYNVSFFLPEPQAEASSLESREKIIEYLSKRKDVIDPATGLPALASNTSTGVPIYVLDPVTRRPIYTNDPNTGARVKVRATVKQHSDPNNGMKIVAIATGTYDELSKMLQGPLLKDVDKSERRASRRSSSKNKFT